MNNTQPIVLDEDEYIAQMEHIIRRDFFPHQHKLHTQLSQLKQQQQDSSNSNSTDNNNHTINNINNTDVSITQIDNDNQQASPSPLSLDRFCQYYTSEDNASFSRLMIRKRREQQERLKRLGMSRRQLQIENVRDQNRSMMENEKKSDNDKDHTDDNDDEYEYEFVQGTLPVKRKKKKTKNDKSVSGALSLSSPSSSLLPPLPSSSVSKHSMQLPALTSTNDLMKLPPHNSGKAINHGSSRFHIPDTPQRELLLLEATNKIQKQKKMSHMQKRHHGGNMSVGSASGHLTPMIQQRIGALSPAAQNLLSSSMPHMSRGGAQRGSSLGRGLFGSGSHQVKSEVASSSRSRLPSPPASPMVIQRPTSKTSTASNNNNTNTNENTSGHS